ncbi:hypothetical protein BC826DRAFT_470817 [Russula brevipes]|nr:hypothetical protein BC826DRAFT_470817 [Russula brevipes]
MTTVFPLPSPALPDFTTLLLKGPYHASAPIHLCLTHLAIAQDRGPSSSRHPAITLSRLCGTSTTTGSTNAGGMVPSLKFCPE